MPDQWKLRMSRASPQSRGKGGRRMCRQQQRAGVVLAAVATQVAELQEKFGEHSGRPGGTGSHQDVYPSTMSQEVKRAWKQHWELCLCYG